jgi:hypothetical protein
MINCRRWPPSWGTQAEKDGFKLDQVIWDEGVSGVSTKLAERSQGRRLFDLLRNGDTLVVRWVDRLGRNYQDICDTIREFMRRGVVIRTVINGITFDGATKDAMQCAIRDALILHGRNCTGSSGSHQGSAAGRHCIREGEWGRAGL